MIGDEILSGRTHDSNLRHIALSLGQIGIDVREARTVPDVHQKIVKAVQELASENDYVFTTGGIGPTHDDITADAVAAAFGRSISVRDDARAILQDWYDARDVELTEARLRMARIPEGADLIDNPVSGAPGFKLENVHVMAGVPRIMHGMLDAIIPTLKQGVRVESLSLKVEGLREADIATALKTISKEHPNVSVGSYPGKSLNGEGHVSLVVRGVVPELLESAMQSIEAAVEALGLRSMRDPTAS